jgi:signal-transduction protein with cAMP-binding, CBS, and nucleotidyltransferase domain
LPAEDFMALMASSPEFNLFCTQYIASLLNQSRQQLQLQFAQRASEQQTLNSPLAGIGSRSPVTVSPETPVAGGAGNHVESRRRLAGDCWRRSQAGWRIHPSATCSIASCWPICR